MLDMFFERLFFDVTVVFWITSFTHPSRSHIEIVRLTKVRRKSKKHRSFIRFGLSQQLRVAYEARFFNKLTCLAVIVEPRGLLSQKSLKCKSLWTTSYFRLHSYLLPPNHHLVMSTTAWCGLMKNIRKSFNFVIYMFTVCEIWSLIR